MQNPDRLLPSRQLIRQQLDAGKLGEVGLVRIHRWEPRSSQQASSGLPPSLWRDLDLALWLVGQSPTRVFALETDGGSLGRSVQVHLGFSSGAMALIGYSDQLPAGDGYQSLTVIGSAGAAYADDHQNRQLVFRGGNAQAVRAEECGVTLRVANDLQNSGVGTTELSLRSGEPQLRLVAEAVKQSIDSRQAVVLAEEVA